MDIYDIYDETLIEQAREAAKPPWFRAYGIEDLGYVDVETYAASVKEFSGLKLPGLLHTEAYIRALFAHSRRRRTAEQLHNDIEVRLIRQERLTSERDPLELTVIIDESALRRDVGGPEVMQEQLRHLVEMADLPRSPSRCCPSRRTAPWTAASRCCRSKIATNRTCSTSSTPLEPFILRKMPRSGPVD